MRYYGKPTKSQGGKKSHHCCYAWLMDSIESAYLNKALVLLVLGVGVAGFSIYRWFKGNR
jgi:hypothetical protein